MTAACVLHAASGSKERRFSGIMIARKFRGRRKGGSGLWSEKKRISSTSWLEPRSSSPLLRELVGQCLAVSGR